MKERLGEGGTWELDKERHCQQLQNEGGKRGQNLEWQTRKDYIAQSLKKKKEKEKQKKKREEKKERKKQQQKTKQKQAVDQRAGSEWWTGHYTAKGLEKEGGSQGQSLEEGGVWALQEGRHLSKIGEEDL